MQAGLFDPTGRTALVTGGARGLGRAIALGLAGQGADVAIADRDGDGAEEAAEAVPAPGHRAVALRCDVSASSA